MNCKCGRLNRIHDVYVLFVYWEQVSRDATVCIIAFSLVHFTLRWSDTTNASCDLHFYTAQSTHTHIVSVIVFNCYYAAGGPITIPPLQVECPANAIECNSVAPCTLCIAATSIWWPIGISMRAYVGTGIVLWERVLLFGHCRMDIWICHLRASECVLDTKSTRMHIVLTYLHNNDDNNNHSAHKIHTI